MKRSESQSLYSALPGAYISYSSDGGKSVYADKKVIKIKYWKTKDILKSDIYYPKIISQIIPDLLNFTSENNDKVTVDGKLMLLCQKEYRDRVKFVEINNKIDGNQIVGHIDPKMFYCPNCGQIKILKDDNDIVNMYCECNGKKKFMNQYNRIWVCSCGCSYPIDEKNVRVGKDRYFANTPNGIIKENGEQVSIPAPSCYKCNSLCSMENATDPRAFFPRIITSVKLTQNNQAELCESNEGRKLIIEKQIGKISDAEFNSRAKEIGNEPVSSHETINIDDGFDDFFSRLSASSSKTSTLDYEDELYYKLLEYQTIKQKVVTSLEEAKNNAIRFGKVQDENEILSLLKKLKIANISSVSDIEIINTAYGYTRKYQSPDEVRSEKETFQLCAFTSSVNSDNPIFYNIRTKTEGIIIDIDKKELYNYIREKFTRENQFIFKDLNEQEICSWFLNKTKVSTRLIKKFEPILKEEIDCSSATVLFTNEIYSILHTISHMIINSVSKFCGIDKSSLGEMIFTNACSIFIYSQTNQGAVLGALTNMFDRHLYSLLESIYEDNKTCTFDPLCMDTTNGACAACTYLNEVACEHFNNDLSRRYLYGYSEMGKKDYVKAFWEEC